MNCATRNDGSALPRSAAVCDGEWTERQGGAPVLFARAVLARSPPGSGLSQSREGTPIACILVTFLVCVWHALHLQLY